MTGKENFFNRYTIHVGRYLLSIQLLLTCIAGNNVNGPPVFEVGGYPMGLTLYETADVGSKVFTLKGHDPEGLAVKYGVQLTDKFLVDQVSGEMTLAEPLDREEADTIRFRVTLEDSVPQQQQPNIVVVDAYVIVLDENDNPPQFLGLPYEAIVSEDTAPGTTLITALRVIDPDLLGEDIQVTCMFQQQFPDACHKFRVADVEKSQNTYTGALVLQRPLDYKKRAFYHLVLRASDGTNSNSTGVEIKIVDVQNNPPEFLDSLTGVVKEDDPIGTLVMMIKARDGDRGMPRKVVFELATNPFDYFLLDSENGEVRTAKPLDREALQNSTGVLTFKVKAREVVNGQLGNDASTVTISEATVTIKDVNDEAPMFNKKEYSVSIPENIADGTSLPHLDMVVSDPDVGLNSIFSLHLVDITGAFSVEPSQATSETSVNIRVVNGSLDYENPNQRKFIILVIAQEIHTNSKLSSTATVTVCITDVNDNAPSFSNPSYTALLSETTEPDTPFVTITAKDRDNGQFGITGIIYQLIGIGSNLFFVDKKSGSISVAHCSTPGLSPCLDYDEKSEYFFSFKAIDDNGKGQATSVSLRIILTDANDNPPKFQRSIYQSVIDEGAKKFEPPLIVQARDRDRTSKIAYSFIKGNEQGHLRIDSDTGEITLDNHASIAGSNLTNLDSDQDTIWYEVQANDGTFSDQARVAVVVRDVNNNAPVFEHDLYSASVPELSLIGTVVKRLSALDADSGTNAELMYRIQKGASNDFSINETSGVVFVSRTLNYDQRNTYHVQIIAFDKGSPSLTGTTTLFINIENNNDKSPYFTPETQRAEVTEDTEIGTVFFVLKAIDPDSMRPDNLSFTISEPVTAVSRNGQQVTKSNSYKDFFAVDRKTGQVSVVKSLDRNVAVTIRITVMVTDNSTHTLQRGKGSLIITIIKANNSPPIFARPWSKEIPKYSTELLEEQPIGTIVGTFFATDVDNNIAAYTIEPPNEYFQINNVTGAVRTSQVIDYEKTRQLEFKVVAYDTGVPQLSSSAKVIVMIININDEVPKFDQGIYHATMKENSPAGTPVIIVKATDKDEDFFGKVTYRLFGNHSSDFNIGNQTGEITVGNATLIDREIMPEIVVLVLASDNAPLDSRRTTSVSVIIKLVDVNDNQPIFTQHSYHASIAENLSVKPPAPILQVGAVDYDEGINGDVSYKILTGNENGSFSLNSKTGILYSAASLLGRAQTYVIKVEARDLAGKGPYFDTCDIYIRVIPVNQHKPEFIMPEVPNSTIEIPENREERDHLVMTVKATDRDSGDNGKVKYHLKVGNKNVQETEEFSINQESGELRSKIVLDRELISKFELVLVAADYGSPSSYETLRLLTILLIDVNDNVPEFFEEYKFGVTENRPKDYFVGKISAEDRDEGRNAKVYYYILFGNADQSFYIDKSDGSIFTNRSFDREKQDKYILTVLAANNPDIFISSTASDFYFDNQENGYVNVTVKILDENDNPPTFKKSKYYASVSLKANLNELVTQVDAFDSDLGGNGTVQYYVASVDLYKYGSDRSSGSIVPSPFNVTQDGKLVTSEYMEEYNQDRFIVKIVAKETAPPERFSMTKVQVWIFEPCQLIRVILSKPPEKVNHEKDGIVLELANATSSRVVVDDIRYHVDSSGRVCKEWCDLYLLAVDQKTDTITSVPQVLQIIDSKYDFLKGYYSGFAIQNVIPAHVEVQDGSFEIALAALLALLIVIFVGTVTIVIVCCYLKHWIVSVPSRIYKKGGLIKKQMIDQPNTTENPLWMEQKLKLYEEQELTMQVLSEPEVSLGCIEQQNSNMSLAADNTYATIQHPTSSLSSIHHNCSSVPDYTTLPETRNMYESAMGFRGSTFQPVSQLTLDKDELPEFVSGLI